MRLLPAPGGTLRSRGCTLTANGITGGIPCQENWWFWSRRVHSRFVREFVQPLGCLTTIPLECGSLLPQKSAQANVLPRQARTPKRRNAQSCASVEPLRPVSGRDFWSGRPRVHVSPSSLSERKPPRQNTVCTVILRPRRGRRISLVGCQMRSNGEILRRSGGFAASASQNDSPLRQAARRTFSQCRGPDAPADGRPRTPASKALPGRNLVA